VAERKTRAKGPGPAAAGRFQAAKVLSRGCFGSARYVASGCGRKRAELTSLAQCRGMPFLLFEVQPS